MFRIRDFSSFTRVSVKRLRHYDRIGLLRPAFVDPRTRYRFYVAGQLVRVQRIVAMRDLGFSLDEIATLLDETLGLAGTRRRLRAQRVETQKRLATEARRLAALDAHLRELETGRPQVPDVVVRDLPEVLVATRRAKVAGLDGGARTLFEAVEADVAIAGVRATGPPLLLYHDREYRERTVDLEVAVPVTEAATRGPLRAGRRGTASRSIVRTLPGISGAACRVYVGAYEQLRGVHRALRTWARVQGLRVQGPWREVYLQFNGDGVAPWALPPAYLAEDCRHWVTEVQIPVVVPRAPHRLARHRRP